MSRWHWLRHDWGKWEQYTLSGSQYIAVGFLKYDAAHPIPYTELRQRRTCVTCGRTEDEVVR